MSANKPTASLEDLISKYSWGQNEKNAEIAWSVLLHFMVCTIKNISLDEIDIAEEGFDPSTFGLWAQHASAAPLRC